MSVSENGQRALMPSSLIGGAAGKIRAHYEHRDERPFSERVSSLARNKGLLTSLAVIVATLAVALFGDFASADPANRPDGGADIDNNDLIGSAVSSVAASWIAPYLRDFGNTIFSSAQGFMSNVTTNGILGARFDNMFEAVSSGSAASGLTQFLHDVQTGIIMPYAMLVVTIFLVVSLANLLSTAGSNECSISLDRIMMIFVGYFFAITFLQNSWELMALAYNLVAGLIRQISYSMHTIAAVSVIPDDYSDLGGLTMLIVAGLIIWVISGIVAIIVQFSVVARGLLIYIQTTLAPVSIAFMASESSRNMGTGFLKRWFATLLAGVIMTLLLACMSYLVGNTGAITAVDTSDIASWVNSLVMTLPVYIAIAFSMLQSGAWAREFVGV